MGRRRSIKRYEGFFGVSTGTTVTRTTDFWGNPKTIVYNHATGTTREYTHKQGIFGDRTDYRVTRHGEEIGTGYIRKNSWGGYSREYTGKCFRCDGTGIYQPTGKICRKCGGTGVFKK